MLTMLIAAATALAAPAPVQPDSEWARDRAIAGMLRDMAEGCDLDFDVGVTRGINYRHDIGRHLRAMFKDPAACPGLAQRAARYVIELVGKPERAEIDLTMLYRARALVEAGRLVPRDPVAAERYARMLWLYGERSAWRGEPGSQWSGRERPEWVKWSEGAEAMALLAARNGMERLRTTRSLELEAALRLRRDLPHYDPARAVTLYEAGMLSTSHANRQRVSRLLTDGVHLPADYARAARPYRYTGTFVGTVADEAQRELLRIGRQAAAAARNRAERLVALDILSGAALTGDREARVARDVLLRRLGRIERVKLASGDAEKAGRAVDWDIGSGFGGSALPKGPGLRPIRLRGLIGPDGRIVMVLLLQSSGEPGRDRIAMGAWFYRGARADLSATAKGRLVWADLPVIDPLLDSSTAWQRWNR